jgi:hypothetical protein
MRPKPLAIKRIALKQIDRDDHSFSLMPFEEEPSMVLTRHIARIGILHPPIVKEAGAGTYLIVAGRKRLRIVGDLLKQAGCDCLVVPAEFDTLSTLALALDEALLSGPVSPLARAVFFKKALALCPPEEAARRFLPLFGLAPHPFHLPRIATLAALEQPLALALHHGQLDEKTAQAMTELSFRDRLALFDLIDTLQLSVSNQRKIIAICHDLAKRLDTSIHAILAGPELKELIDHPEANPPQKAAQVMRYLGQRHAPDLTAAEKAFTELTRQFNPPSGVSIGHAPAFEKDEVTLTATFADQASLAKVWPAIKAALAASAK